MNISPRFHIAMRDFGPEGSSQSWIRVYGTAVWKFIVHRNAAGKTLHVSAVHMVEGRGVDSKNFSV